MTNGTACAAVSPEVLARAPRRVEGRDKVTGRVRYAGDRGAAEVGGPVDVALAITSPQASGRVLSIDVAEALAAPGVRLVMTHLDAPRLHKVTPGATGNEIGDILPLQDDVIRYGGQCVAVLVADSLENARAAAPLVRIVCSSPSRRAFDLDQGGAWGEPAESIGGGEPGEVKVGHAERAFEACAHRLDQAFETMPHHHNAMEPGAIVAAWDEDGGLTVHVPTQYSYGDAMMLGQAFGFGLKERTPRMVAQLAGGVEFHNKVRVICPLIGGSFGGKTGNVHLLLAPMAAKLNGRAVKLVLTRRHVFSLMPLRGETRQRLRIGADEGGRFQAVIDDTLVARGAGGSFVEPVIETIAKVYAASNFHLTTRAAKLDTAATGWMRGPGSSLGQFALETAVDMLAHEVGMDPLDYRLLNHAEVEPDTGKEWSSKSLRACYEAGATAIGWHDRDPAVGAMREGRHLIGYGMATSLYATKRFPSVARVLIDGEGRGVVESSSHELGQGTLTAMTQIAAEALGLPLDQVTFRLGDTALPYGGMTVGSATTLSNGSAIRDAAIKVRIKLLKRASRDPGSPFHKADPSELSVVGGCVVHPDGRSEPMSALMARQPKRRLEAEAITGRTMGRSKYARWAFGAQYARVVIDPETAHVQVDRMVGAFAGGRIINPVTTRSQLLGGMVLGLGQAMMEESAIDRRTGMWMNRTLAEALVPTNADVSRIDIVMIEEDDTRGHPLGVKGLGEIGVVGTAPAIGNAIFHATGIRLTALPFRVDRLLAGLNGRVPATVS